MRQSLRPAPAGARDTFLDVVRAIAILAVIGQHWLMPVLSYDHGTLATGNALTTPGWWALTWLSQVMPMVFFAGGAANLLSLRRAASTRDWLSTRLKRLLIPVLPLFAVWLLAPDLLRDLGAPEQPVQIAGAIAGQLLWFLAVYLLTVAVTPLMLAAHRRWGLGVPLVLTGLAVVVDVGRFEVFGPLGYVNAVFVWLAVHQLGFHYVEGRLATLSRRGAAGLAMAGFGVTALAVAFGPYPASMIGMPGAPVSNMSPPTAVLMSLAVGQAGFWLALKPALATLAERPAVAAVLRWSGPRFMSLYLWHMPALVVVAGVAVLGFGYATPEPGSADWFAVAPMWAGAAAVVLAGLLRAFGRFETRPGTGSAVPARQLALATVLASGGLLGLAAHGFTTPPHGGPFSGPLPWVALVLTALVLVTKPVRVAVRG
ncbi:acyltransferase family protein [Amycolatopsis thermophila]|uniref:Fucose 4-O-acetylase-like acetyltransferase n=1 Tax=Amycolatopsis thermophila TaxID=206084 RepID=A0ABU0EQP3_9PSEU|nr:acyltransferase [Amycolatopsis thermophila]MDQ0377107.1 fucose 4-O-acetylase-like acetyltransferase [Amycolatopsis thermophila]